MEIIYIDSLFLLNFIIDYLLLLATAKICALRLVRLRMALGALWGGAYAILAVLLPSLFSLAVVKLVAGVLVAAVAFAGQKRFARSAVVFFAVSAAFGGAVYAATGLSGQTAAGRLFIPVSMRVLILSFAVCYAVLTLVFRHMGKRSERQVHQVELKMGGKAVSFSALEDTGNELCDPISGDPVMVVEFSCLAPFFPSDTQLTNDPLEAFTRFSALPGFSGRFRILPYKCVSAESSLLLCFRPDEVKVDGKKRAGVLVGFCRGCLCPDGEYQAII